MASSTQPSPPDSASAAEHPVHASMILVGMWLVVSIVPALAGGPRLAQWVLAAGALELVGTLLGAALYVRGVRVVTELLLRPGFTLRDVGSAGVTAAAVMLGGAALGRPILLSGWVGLLVGVAVVAPKGRRFMRIVS